MALRIGCDLDGTVADMDSALQREAVRLFGPEVDLHARAGERAESVEDVEERIAGSRGTERELADDTALEPAAPDKALVGASAARTPSLTGRRSSASTARRALTRREWRQLWAYVAGTENFWRSLTELEPGEVARFGSLATEHRWEVLFLTQRPPSAGETAQIQTQRWLQAHGFELPSVMVMRGSRGKVAAALALDAVIDDRPENCVDVTTDSTARSILVWRQGTEWLPPGVAGMGIDPVSSFSEALTRLEALTQARARKRSLLGRLRGAFSR